MYSKKLNNAPSRRVVLVEGEKVGDVLISKGNFSKGDFFASLLIV
jgi:hypothetical protein